MTASRVTINTPFPSSASSFDIPLGDEDSIPAGALISVGFVRAGVNAINAPAGWRVLYNGDNGVNMIRGCFLKKAVGDEGGTALNITTIGSGKGAAQVDIISDWGGDINNDVAVSSASNAYTAAPNPPSVTAPWGSADNLFIEHIFLPGNITLNAGSSGFSDVQNSTSASDGASMGSAIRAVTTDTLDPAATTVSSDGWGSTFTVVVKPAAATPVITNVDGDDTVTDGQANIEINGTNLDIVTSVVLKSGSFTDEQVIGTAVAGKVTLSGPLLRVNCPLSSANHTVSIEVSDGENTYSKNITLQPASGFAVVDSDSDTGDSKSLSSLFPEATFEDGAQFVHPTSMRSGGSVSLSVFANGTFKSAKGGTEPDWIDSLTAWTPTDGVLGPIDVRVKRS